MPNLDLNNLNLEHDERQVFKTDKEDIVLERPKLRWHKRLILLTLASLIIALNINSFIYAGDLVPGGFNGLAILLQRIFLTYFDIKVSYTIIYLPLNTVGFYLGLRYIGKKFTWGSIYVIVLSSLLIDLIPHITVTYDILLIALFGAIFNSIAMTLCLYAEACSGGTDFISIYLSTKKGVNAWNYIFAANVVMLIVAGILFGFDKALYSIIYQFTQTQILNTFNKRYLKHTLLIITKKPEATYEVISRKTHHSATLFKGTGLYKHEEVTMVYSVINSEDLPRITKAIRDVDEKAFINVFQTESIEGNFFQRPSE